MTNIGNAKTIDLQDLRALRHADDLVFQHYQGQSSIRAIKRVSSDAGFDQEHRIPTGSVLRDYGFDHGTERREYSAFYMKHTAQYSETIRTMIGHIAKGDVLTLEWTRSNDCEAITRVGFHQDELRLRVTRPTRNRTYLVAVAVGPDNTARMVKRTAP